MMEKYIHKVNYYETDKMGITHHSNYIRWMEEDLPGTGREIKSNGKRRVRMYYNIYFSPTGGTKKVADIFAENLQGDYQDVDLCHDIQPMTLQEEDVCLISVPSYGGRVPAVNLERLRKLQANGAKAVLNCVYGNRHWDDTLTELQDTLEDLGFVCVAAVAAVAEHSIFRQFAAGRPDADDEKQLAAFAKEIQGKLNDGNFGKLELEGAHGPYKEYKGVPYQPETGENCTLCGLCARECPVGAIDPATPNKINKETCISCMRCSSLCPTQARGLDEVVMKERAELIAPHLGGHKENHLFL